MIGMPPEQKQRLIEQLGDQYGIGEVIGQGGQAIVFRAVHLRLNREIALKVLRDDALDHPGHLARFTREIRILSALQHPNIVRIYDTCPDHPWFTAELIQGFDILEYADLNGLGIRQRVEIFTKVAGAIGAAHLLAITHRDLKPSNILVDLDAEPHVVDFGLACDASEAGQEWIQITITGAPIGTLPYSSPEQVAGEKADPTSDVYSLGVVLYQLLTGELPYEISNDHACAFHNIKYSDPARNRKIPGDLWRVIRRAMQKDRTRRYPNATELGLDLQRYLRGEPVQATEDRMYRVWKFLERHSHAAIATFAIAVAATVGLTGLWLAERADRRANRISRDAQVALESSALLRMGSVDRDAGRTALAAQAYREVIAMTKIQETSDPTVLSIRYKALHRLSWQLYVDGQFTKADALCAEAVEIAERTAREHPDDGRWRRHLAFSYILRGKRDWHRNDWAGALHDFTVANDQLSAINADLVDLAFCFRWQGRAALEIGQVSDALRFFENARATSVRAHELRPDVVEYTLDIARSDKLMARGLARTGAFGDAADRCRQALEDLANIEPDHGMRADFLSVKKDVTSYLDWVTGKIGNAAPHGLPASSEVSAGSPSPSSSGVDAPTSMKK